jgi:hypothetical protein
MKSWALFALSAFVLVGCGSSTLPTDPIDNGRPVQFVIAGSGYSNTLFQSESVDTVSFGVFQLDKSMLLTMVGFSKDRPNEVSTVQFSLSDTVAKSYVVNSGTSVAGTMTIVDALASTTKSFFAVEDSCTVTVTSVSAVDGMLKGTFSGVFVGTGAASSTIRVSNGSFSIKREL